MSGETLVEARIETDVQILRYDWVLGRKTKRPIWFPPKFPSGQLELNSFHQVMRMMGGRHDGMVMHAIWMINNGKERGKKDRNTRACEIGNGGAIRSHGEDVRVAHIVPCSTHAQTLNG